jgi:hypothetical protein
LAQLATGNYVLGFAVVSADYKLQTLLELRELAVVAAERSLRDATSLLAQHEAEQRRLSAKVQAKQAKLQQLAASGVGRTAAAFQSKDRFAAKLRSDYSEAVLALGKHETEVLAATLTLEQQARDELRKANQEAALINRHRDNADAMSRKAEDRRADAESNDWSMARSR